MKKITIMVKKNGSSWSAFFPDKPDVTGVAKRKEDAITALMQDNLGKMVLMFSEYFEIIDNTEGVKK